MAKRRPSGDGMVRKREDGRWEGRIVVGHKENGEPIFRYVLAKTQKELLAKLHRDMDLYQDAQLTEDSRMTLGEWLDRWMEEYGAVTLRPNTLRSYEQYIRCYVKPYLGGKIVSRVTRLDIQKLYRKLKKEGRVHDHPEYGHELSDSMVLRIHAMLHRCLKDAERDHIVPYNPTDGVKLPKSNYKPKQVLDREQLDAFLAAVDKNEIWRDFFYTELTTGLRRGEICGLMWRDFDENAGTLKILRSVNVPKRGELEIGETKTERGRRTIRLPPSTVQRLKERKKHAISQWIFPEPLAPEKPVRPSAAYYWMKALLKEAGLPHIRFHDLRHTFSIGRGVEPMARKRKSGTGTIRQRKDGRWEGRAVVGYDDKGLPKTKNVLAKTKHECQEKLTKLMETVGSAKSEKICADMPFGEWMDFWYQTYIKSGLRPATQNTYESTIYQHIIPQLGKIPLCQLTQKDLQQFYAHLKKEGRLVRTEQYGKGLSDRMVRMCHAKCRAALDQAVQENLIRTNPAVGCKLPPKRSREMQVLSHQELQRFLIQAKADGYFELFLLDLSTGLRRGELLALQWSDLDLDTGTLSVTKQVYEVNGKMQLSVPKTKASIRKLVLPPAVVEVFREYRKAAKSRWLFPSPIKEDEPIKPSSVLRRLQVILERAGCKKIRFHDLRHTFATMALENGMDIKTLSAMLGHVSAATTLDIYTHITGDMLSEAAAKIDRGLGNEVAEDSTEANPLTDFQPVMRRIRKPGTGCITQINDHLFEGRYSPTWPDGTKHSKCVYAHTREECEEKLKVLIQQLNAERKAILDRLRGIPLPEKLTKKQRQIWEYMKIYPDETNYSTIAKGAKVTRHTVAKHFEMIQKMLGTKETASFVLP